MTGPLHSSIDDRSRAFEVTHDLDPEPNEEDQPMADGGTFQPGQSFVEDDRPAERLSDMPAWLQTFAAQESTRDEHDPAEDIDVSLAEPETRDESAPGAASDSILPDWLQDKRGDVAGDQDADSEPASMMDFLSSFDDPEDPDTQSFLSEDDLPDWLRAFSDESSAPGPARPDVTRLPAARTVPQPGAAIVRVPPVENVWLSAYERQALGPGGTLFALLASNGNGALTHTQTADGDTATEARSAPRGDHERSAMSRRAEGTVVAPQTEAAKQPNSLRWLLLTLLIVALVVAISLWQFS